MKRDLMEILACPVCKGPLELLVDREEGEEIIEGTLICQTEVIHYPIVEGIPNLLSLPPANASAK